jgi:hypothetical protein
VLHIWDWERKGIFKLVGWFSVWFSKAVIGVMIPELIGSRREGCIGMQDIGLESRASPLIMKYEVP